MISVSRNCSLLLAQILAFLFLGFRQECSEKNERSATAAKEFVIYSITCMDGDMLTGYWSPKEI